MDPIKCVVVGDSGVGKSCLLIRYKTKSLPEFKSSHDYYINKLVNTSKKIQQRPVHLGLWDTIGHESYDRFRPFSYLETDVFMICFSLVDPISFQKVKSKWHPEIRQHSNSGVPLILVGTKLDLRNKYETLDKSESIKSVAFSRQQGKIMADEIKAKYLECSSSQSDECGVNGVDDVFNAAINDGFNQQKLEDQLKKLTEKEKLEISPLAERKSV